MKITQVEPQKKNPYRYNIFLDGQFAFGVDEDALVSQRLIVGKEISTEELPKILFETEVGKLMERMYALFTRRQRSEKEVRDYLRNLSFKRKVKDQEEISLLVIDAVVERLKQRGLINDSQFAQDWLQARRSSKKKGKIALKMELIQKGIDKETIDQLDENISNEDEVSVAKQALEKKLKSWQHLPEIEFKQKAIAFLMRRGFAYEVAKDIVGDAVDDTKSINE